VGNQAVLLVDGEEVARRRVDVASEAGVRKAFKEEIGKYAPSPYEPLRGLGALEDRIAKLEKEIAGLKRMIRKKEG
jgi:uncharacterized small protein (DUF1192 family)